MNWQRFFPFLQWPRPSADTLRKDAWAGISVGLVLVPQALAYAALAGMPPQTGLYAALLPAIVGILWGSSPLLAVGPVALTSMLTYASLEAFATPGSGAWVSLAVWLAIYAGVIQFALGALRLGIITNFVSYPVIAGFINAAAITIVLSQLPALLGLPLDVDATWFSRIAATASDAPQRLAATAAFGLGGFVLLLLQRRIVPQVPGVLVICVAGTLISALTDFDRIGGAVIGAVSGGLPHFGSLPALRIDQHRALLPAAFIIAVISFVEAMSSCKTLARKRGEQWDENQELIGQGLAKISSGLCGAFPVSGSFSRSALNLYVGATSGWSTLFAAGSVLACLLWLTPYLRYLPRALLAAIIVASVLSLITPRIFRHLWRISRDDGAVALATLAITLFSAPQLQWGVFAGFTAAIFCYLYRSARPRIIEVGEHPDGTLRDRERFGLPPLAPGVVAIRMDSSLTYITAPVLERTVLDRVRAAAEIHTVVLCSSPFNDIDMTGVESLQQLQRNLRALNVTLRFSALKKQVWEVMERAGLTAELGPSAFFSTDREAIEALRASATDATAADH